MFLATLGYEGLNVENFFAVLKHSNIQTLVDIRELPISRKRGFSKTALSGHAINFGLRYIHIPGLGAPRDVRHEYRDDDDWERFSNRYKAHLKLQVEEIDELAELITHETCCLLCFEANHLRCHRRYVASALYARTNGEIKINHLAAIETKPAAWLRSSAGIALQQ